MPEYICENGCMYQWICAHCKDSYCDDIQSPFIMIKHADNIREQIEFCLCENCKHKYYERNLCKGRHKSKIKNISWSH